MAYRDRTSLGCRSEAVRTCAAHGSIACCRAGWAARFAIAQSDTKGGNHGRLLGCDWVEPHLMRITWCESLTCLKSLSMSIADTLTISVDE